MPSRFLGETARGITPYVPGEQPRDQAYIKLNTNENPYPPSPKVREALAAFAEGDLRLYPDPDAALLTGEMARFYGLPGDMVFAAGGSDEALGYAFMAFADRGSRVYFPDITYGFYKVYADLFGLEARELPLREDFTIAAGDYFGLEGMIVLANPNAPTGLALARGEIEHILQENQNCLVLVDEAYADFAGGLSCVGLTARYGNLLVVQTFSKSRALAGMRLGFAFGQPGLIEGLNRIKYSFNPYNLDRISLVVGIASIRDFDYTKRTINAIINARDRTAESLTRLGFTVLPSRANFLFAAYPGIGGAALSQKLRERGILTRHFDKDRIRDFLRITVGTEEQMQTLTAALEQIIKGESICGPQG
jgi:histidinol-phosphate aminotransferase